MPPLLIMSPDTVPPPPAATAEPAPVAGFAKRTDDALQALHKEADALCDAHKAPQKLRDEFHRLLTEAGGVRSETITVLGELEKVYLALLAQPPPPRQQKKAKAPKSVEVSDGTLAAVKATPLAPPAPAPPIDVAARREELLRRLAAAKQQ